MHTPAAIHRPKLIYRFARWSARRYLRTFHGADVAGTLKIPTTGPVLLIANHQSFLDPPLIGGFVRHRTMSFLARAGLFKVWPLGWLIRSLNSVPIQESAGDVGAMKEILRRLGDGHAVLVFPEGSRSSDGAMSPFKRGVSLLIKRAKCPVVPIAIEGAFDAWPRSRSTPRCFAGPVMMRFGDPIQAQELLAGGAEAGLARVQTIIDGMRLDLRSQIRARTRGKFPPPGPGDAPFAPAPGV